MEIANLSIIIVTYKSNFFLEDCLNSIGKQKIFPDEIIIHDNNSPISPKTIVDKFSKDNPLIRINFLSSKKNVGFATGVNYAVKKARNPTIMLLNPDLIVEGDAIDKLYQFFKNSNYKRAVIVGGRSMSWDGSKVIDTVVKEPKFINILFEFTSLKKIFPDIIYSKGFWDRAAIKTKKEIDVYGISGNFFMIEKNDFYEIGMLDQKYFLYLEDVDFCIRANKKGFKIMYYPFAVVKHFHGGSSRTKRGKINQFAWDDSKRYFVKKWYGFKGKLLNILFKIDDMAINTSRFFRKIK